MWGGIVDIIQGLTSLSRSSSSSGTRERPQVSERQNHNSNMQQKTGVHVHINNYSCRNGHSSTRPPRQTSNANQKIGQNQATSKAIGRPGYTTNPQYTRQTRGLENTNYTPRRESYQEQFSRGQKPTNNNENQKYRNFNQNHQNSTHRFENFRQDSRQQRDAGRSGYDGGLSRYDGNDHSANSPRVLVVKKTKVINKKIIITNRQ